jgi:hypothetical protein
MPRVKKPLNLEFDLQAALRAARVTLEQDTVDFLAQKLSIDNKDKARIGKMVTYVEGVLTTHKIQSERPDKPPTLASQISLFESLEKSAHDFLKEFRLLKKNYCICSSVFL